MTTDENAVPTYKAGFFHISSTTDVMSVIPKSRISELTCLFDFHTYEETFSFSMKMK